MLPVRGLAQKDTLAGKTYDDLSNLMKSYSSPLTFDLINYYEQKAKDEANIEEQFKAKSKFIEASIWNRKFDVAKDSMPSLRVIAAHQNLQSQFINSLYEIGRAYFFQGTWGRAIDSYDEALKLAEKTNDKIFQQKLLLDIGYIKSSIGDNEEGIKLHKKSLQLLKDTSFDDNSRKKKEGTIFFYLSRAYIARKEQDSASYYIGQALLSVQKPKDSCTRKKYLCTKAEIEILSNKFKAAKNTLKKGMSICKPLTKGDSLIYYVNYGKLSLAQQEYETAVKYLQESLDNYNVKKEEEGFMQDHYKLLALAYKHTGEIEKSNFYLLKYVNTTDEFIKIQDSVSQRFKKLEIQEFKKELNAITAEKNEKQSNFNYLLLAGSLIILALLFVLLKFYRNKKANEIKFEALLVKIKTAEKSENIIDTKDEILEEKNSSDVSEEVTNQILDGLKKLEAKEYFLSQDCNSYNVAKKINTNTSYLSKVINSHYGKNFNTYINDLRINYAIVRLKNDVIFRSYSIQSIAEELGYKSADSFTKYFKKDTGLNPSFYIKEIKNIA